MEDGDEEKEIKSLKKKGGSLERRGKEKKIRIYEGKEKKKECTTKNLFFWLSIVSCLKVTAQD